MNECIETERRELTRAFAAFNELSGQLRASYAALEARVAALTAELEQARRDTRREARNAESLAARLQLLLSTLPAGVVVVDADGRIQQVNPAAEAILGTAHIGESWHEVARHVFRQQLTANGDWVRHDDRRISMLAANLPEGGAKIVVMTDVTEPRAIEELVSRNQRLSAMGKMAASLAHQIRTPLAGALLHLSQSRPLVTSIKQSELLERSIERLHHLDRLVQDMLVFARGSGPGERVRVADLFRAVHDAVAGIKPALAHLIIDGQDSLVELQGNRTALAAALTNLVSNALEASPEVVVTLRAELRASRVVFTVQDNGPGIAPQIQSKVFEPFFSTRPAGTGLGLAVVKTVTEAHGGALALESTPEHGTCIGMDLPRDSHLPDPLPPEPSRSPPLARDVA
jgi:two-component system, sensor histidine kinase FlrB